MCKVLCGEKLGSEHEGNVSFHLCTYAFGIKLPTAVTYLSPRDECVSNKGSPWDFACRCSHLVRCADGGTSAAPYELGSSLVSWTTSCLHILLIFCRSLAGILLLLMWWQRKLCFIYRKNRQSFPYFSVPDLKIWIAILFPPIMQLSLSQAKRILLNECLSNKKIIATAW